MTFLLFGGGMSTNFSIAVEKFDLISEYVGYTIELIFLFSFFEIRWDDILKFSCSTIREGERERGGSRVGFFL